MNWTYFAHPSGEWIYGLFSNYYSTNHYIGGSMKPWKEQGAINPIWAIYCGTNAWEGAFSKARDNTFDGQEYYKEDFEKIPWFYCPGGAGRAAGVYGVNATYFASQETALRKEELTNNLVVTVYHNGKEERISVPIYIDSYECTVSNK